MNAKIAWSALVGLALAAGGFCFRSGPGPEIPKPPPPLSPAALIPPAPQSRDVDALRQDYEASRSEVLTLKASLSAAEDRDKFQHAIYAGLLAQAQKNLATHPLAMTWQDFYLTSEGMGVDEDTLIQNIVLRLQREVALSDTQCRDLIDLLEEERRDLARRFRSRYAAQIEGDRLGMLPEEARIRTGADIAAIRQEVRKGNEGRYQTLFPETQLRAIRLHLRNDFTVAYTSDGDVLGGVGIPDSRLSALDGPPPG